MKAGLKSGMKEFAKSMEGTMKSVAESLKNLDLCDIGNVISSAFGKFKASAEKELILSADGVQGLELRTGSGDFAVTGGDTGDIIIQAVVTVRGADEEDAKARAEEIQLVHSLEDGALKVKDSGASNRHIGRRDSATAALTRRRPARPGREGSSEPQIARRHKIRIS